MRHRWIALIAVLLLAGSVAPADAASTVFWTGANAFDDQTITSASSLAAPSGEVSG